MRRFFGVLAFLVSGLLSLAVQAQTGTATTDAPTDTKASSAGCYTAPAVNATQAAGTCSIVVPAGQYAYFNYLQVGACIDNTANAVNTPQLAFTSTNLGGWTQQLTVMQGATIATVGPYISCLYIGGSRTHPLKSAAGPVTVTIVPPAQQAHSAYPINAEYFFAQ